MRIGLHDAERDHMPAKTFPNYALMKLAAWHRARGDRVDWWIPMGQYDLVYSSKVFTYFPDNLYLPPDAILGGTGYDVHSQLPDEVDAMFPDYSLYPSCDYAIGYTTRGCPNCCRWCVVPDKEGGIRPYRDWRELVRPDSDKLILMDNNILACDYGLAQLESLAGSGYRLDVNQGMDARLVTPEVADFLSRLSWIRFLRFSCDQWTQVEAILRTCELLLARDIRPYRVFIYLLVTADLADAARRVEALKVLRGVNLYAQAERNEQIGITPGREQLEFVRYVYSGKYRSETWDAFRERHLSE